jgi:peptidoglycan/LPS O-acetylase OafA/YrhL
VNKPVKVGRIESLTGVRGAAALWVLLHHLMGTFPVDRFVTTHTIAENSWGWALQALRNFADKGWLGVDLFFVLSGFVISYVHRDEFSDLRWDRYFRFLRLRIARIYPAHLATTLLLVPMVALAWFFFSYRPQDTTAFSGAKLAYSVLLVHGWGIPNSIGWNVPSWSVSSEWFAYLCFPLIAFVTCKIRSVRTSVALAASIFLAVVLLSAHLNGTRKFMFDESLTILRVSYEFATGCLLFNIFAGLQNKLRFDAICILSILVVIVAAVAAIPSRFDWVFVLAFSTLVLGLSTSQGLVARAFASRPMMYLGEISYSIYLVHSLVLIGVSQVAKKLFEYPNWRAAAATALASIIASIVGGHLLYGFVELPWRKRLRGRMDRTEILNSQMSFPETERS